MHRNGFWLRISWLGRIVRADPCSMHAAVSTSIVIGIEPGGSAVHVDIEELLATRLLVQGNSGSGKSHLLRRLIEQSAPYVQQVIVDPEGDYVQLAERYGHVVIAAQDYSAKGMEEIGARVRQHRYSAVLNLEHMPDI